MNGWNYHENQVICGDNELYAMVDRFTFVAEVIDEEWLLTTDKSARKGDCEMCGLQTLMICASYHIWVCMSCSA